MQEIWKPIRNFEGYYEVSNLGNVRGVDRIIFYKNGKKVHIKGKIKKQVKNPNGYMQISLRKNGEMKSFYIHRLVAEAFLDNPNNLPCVNHKDETRNNNLADNLEWCDYSYNNNYGNCNEKRKRNTDYKNRNINYFVKPIYQYKTDGTFIASYKSSIEASKLGYSADCIRKCCCNYIKTHQGFIWSYTTMTLNEIELKMKIKTR